jgi:hypothetical protein
MGEVLGAGPALGGAAGYYPLHGASDDSVQSAPRSASGPLDSPQ